MANLLDKLKPARHIVTKYNEAEFNHFFDNLIAQTDKVIAAQVSCGNSVQRESATPVASQDVSTPAGIGYVEEDGGFVSDWRDAEGITDAAAESERFK